MRNMFYYCKECHGVLFLYEVENHPDITDDESYEIDGERYCKECKNNRKITKLIPYECKRCGNKTGHMHPSSDLKHDASDIELICNRCYVKEAIGDSIHDMVQPMFDELTDCRDMEYSEALHMIMQEMEATVRKLKIELRDNIAKEMNTVIRYGHHVGTNESYTLIDRQIYKGTENISDCMFGADNTMLDNIDNVRDAVSHLYELGWLKKGDSVYCKDMDSTIMVSGDKLPPRKWHPTKSGNIIKGVEFWGEEDEVKKQFNEWAIGWMKDISHDTAQDVYESLLAAYYADEPLESFEYDGTYHYVNVPLKSDSELKRDALDEMKPDEIYDACRAGYQVLVVGDRELGLVKTMKLVEGESVEYGGRYVHLYSFGPFRDYPILSLPICKDRTLYREDDDGNIHDEIHIFDWFKEIEKSSPKHVYEIILKDEWVSHVEENNYEDYDISEEIEAHGE